MKKLLYLCVCIALVASCNKEKRYSKKLMKGDPWKITRLTADGQDLGLNGSTWLIVSDVDIYDSVPRVMWNTSDVQNSVFEWQFRDKGKTFHLNYIQLCEECDGADLSALDYTTYDLTGAYKVERHGRKRMEFTSTATLGYPGKEVVIAIER